MRIHANPHPDPDTQPCFFPVTTNTACTGNIVVMWGKWSAYLEHTSSLKLGRRLIVLILPSLGCDQGHAAGIHRGPQSSPPVQQEYAPKLRTG